MGINFFAHSKFGVPLGKLSDPERNITWVSGFAAVAGHFFKKQFFRTVILRSSHFDNRYTAVAEDPADRLPVSNRPVPTRLWQLTKKQPFDLRQAVA